MPGPIPQKVNPGSGNAGDIFSPIVTGDSLLDVVKADFGPEISTQKVDVIDGSTVRVKIQISVEAKPGKRNVTLTNTLGQSGTVPQGFEVVL
jgi:hypothetical protein